VASAANTQTGLGGRSEVTGRLHYSAACGDYDGGTLRYASGSAATTVTYTGCGVRQ
jgi:hypothetical protein